MRKRNLTWILVFSLLLPALFFVGCDDGSSDAAAPITITFDKNSSDAVGTMAAQSIEAGATAALTSNTFSLTDHSFAGWNTAADGSGTSYSDGQSITPGQDMTLYAQWADSIAITFNGNGSTSGSMSNQMVPKNTASSITANAFARTDHLFEGWNTIPDGSGDSYDDEGSITLSSPITLYAIWEHETITVTYNGNGSTAGNMSAQVMDKNTATALTTNAFTRTDWTFTGWNTKADGSGDSYTDGQEVTLAADTTLYAQWTSNTIQVSFNANGGQGSMTEQNMLKNTSTALSANTFTYAEHVFTGWNTKADGSGDSYTDQQSVTLSAPIELYAQWIERVFVTFYGNESTSGNMAAQEVGYNVPTDLTANAFERNEYHFTGWNTKADGSGDSYTDQQSVTLTSSLDLYAQWEYIMATITFDKNGGNGVMTPQKVQKSTSTPLSQNVFTKDGSVFVNWNTKADGSGTSYSDKQSVSLSGDITLYAQWMERIYVTFHGNGNTSGNMSAQNIGKGVATALTENAFVKTDHHFVSWNTEANGSGSSYADKATVTLNTSTSLYAQWEHDTANITFSSNGGSGSMASQTVDTNTLTAINANTFTKTDYHLASWNTASNGSGTSYTAAAEISISSDITLYAIWEHDTADITFNGNGSTSGTMYTQTINTKTDTALSVNSYERSGYAFTGWNTSSGGTGTAYADGAKVNLSGNITLYAQWVEAVTVTCYKNDGGGSYVSYPLPKNTKSMLRRGTFTRDGYQFVGWNTASDITGDIYTDEESVTLNADLTLYAQWVPANTFSSGYNPLRLTKGSAYDSSTFTGKLAIPKYVDNSNKAVTVLETELFKDSTGLTEFKLPETVTTLNAHAFFNTGLTNVVLPGTVTTVSNGVFMKCTQLESATLPDSITSLAGDFFNGCTALETAVLPSNITTLPSGLFMGASSLASITIPSSVVTINQYAFSGCVSLSSITVPAGVTKIDYAGLESIPMITVLAETPPQISSSAITLGATIKVPAGSVDAYKTAANWNAHAANIQPIE